MTTTTSNVKVSKDGVVTKDGTVIGRVVRQEIPYGVPALVGMRVTMAGGVVWDAVNAEGKTVADGLGRRKDAVDRVVDDAEPLNVTNVKREMVLGTRVPAITADVRIKGNLLGVSRTQGETFWRVYYIHQAGAVIPRLSTGVGHGGHQITDPDVLAALDAAVAASQITL